MKSQQVRLFDIWVLGPAMMYIASARRLSQLQRVALFAAGAGTILYNWRNYAELAQKSPELETSINTKETRYQPISADIGS